MRPFRDAVAHVLAGLTPQPWDYTTPDGVTLTVIPEGLPSEPGYAEVTVRVTASKHQAAEIGIMTPAIPALIAALEAPAVWEHSTVTDDVLTVTLTSDGLALRVLERYFSPTNPDRVVEMRLPADQRMPLASALRRALDVARGWES